MARAPVSQFRENTGTHSTVSPGVSSIPGTFPPPPIPEKPASGRVFRVGSGWRNWGFLRGNRPFRPVFQPKTSGRAPGRNPTKTPKIRPFSLRFSKSSGLDQPRPEVLVRRSPVSLRFSRPEVRWPGFFDQIRPARSPCSRCPHFSSSARESNKWPFSAFSSPRIGDGTRKSGGCPAEMAGIEFFLAAGGLVQLSEVSHFPQRWH